MAAQPPDPEVENLLAELRSDDADRRKAAAEKIAEVKLQNTEITGVIKTLAQTDPDASVRYWAEQALMAIGVTKLSLVPGASASPSSKPVRVLSRNEKIRDFGIGFVGWYLINFTIYAVTGYRGQGSGAAICIVFPANIIVLIVLAFKRRWVAFGMLSAIALNLLVALVLGLTMAGWCFIPFFTPGLR